MTTIPPHANRFLSRPTNSLANSLASPTPLLLTILHGPLTQKGLRVLRDKAGLTMQSPLRPLPPPYLDKTTTVRDSMSSAAGGKIMLSCNTPVIPHTCANMHTQRTAGGRGGGAISLKTVSDTNGA